MRPFGKYRLVEPVASGGMAEVWRAEAPGAEGFVKEVALKLIRGDHDARGDFVRMFIQEARLASRLTHANIVQVFDFDQVDGRYYLAMELVRGRTLREVVDRCREAGLRFGVPRAVHVCAEVARALAYAHRLEEGGRPAGLVHRDVSPQNVLVSFEGEVKLTDFGIARALGATEVTAPGTLKGKLAYMAPEQARSGPVDARADVFSAGVVLWELCTGRRLFARDTEAATMAAVLSDEPVSAPSAWNEAVPPELDRIVLAALERDPARRTATAQELADGLASVRLQVARGYEDLDLRALMFTLWPDGAAAVSRGEDRPRAQRTDVRELAPAAQGELAAPAADGSRASDAAVAVTRTRHAPPARRRGRLAAGALVAVALAVAAALGLLRSSRAPSAALEREPSTAAPRAGPGAAPAAPATSPPAAPAATPERAPLPVPSEAHPAAAQPAAPTASAAPAAAPPPTRPARPASRPAASAAARAPARQAPAAPLPAAAAAETERATLVVRVAPWADVEVDGEHAGDTPLERELAPGRHTLRARHPRLGAAEATVELAPGQRFVWTPRLE